SDTATTDIYPLSLHDALPILRYSGPAHRGRTRGKITWAAAGISAIAHGRRLGGIDRHGIGAAGEIVVSCIVVAKEGNASCAGAKCAERQRNSRARQRHPNSRQSSWRATQ